MIELDHPDRCHAAECKVPSITDVFLMVPTGPMGGRKFEQRICLGHLIALKDLVTKLQRLRIPIQLLTPADLAAQRAAQQPRIVFTFNGGYNTNSTTTTTGAFFFRQ